MADSSSSSSSSRNGNGSSIITPMISVASLLLGLGVAFWTNSKGDVNTVKFELREDLRLAEERVAKEILVIRELIQQKVVYVDTYKTYQDRVDRIDSIFQDDIKALRADQVPRSEHIQHWNEIADRIADLRNALTDERKQRTQDVTDIRKDFGGTYTLGDVVKQLQAQIQLLNQRLDSLKAAPATAPNNTRLNSGSDRGTFYVPQSIADFSR